MISPLSTTETHAHSVDGRVSCQNCGHNYVGRYCTQCSQRADTHPIDWHYIWHEIPHSVWHVDRGIAFTLRELITRPGHTIREFLEGKRVNHYRPLALLLLLGAVVVFAQHMLGVSFVKASQEMFNADTADASARIKAFRADANQFIERNQNLLYIFMIPLFAFGSWLLFRRQRYNYPQMLVVQTFITNFHLLVSLVIVVLFWAIGGTATAFSFAMSLSMVIMLAYNTIVYYQLFEGRLRPLTVAIRSLLAYAVGYLLLILIVALVTMVYAFIVAAKDPH